MIHLNQYLISNGTNKKKVKWTRDNGGMRSYYNAEHKASKLVAVTSEPDNREKTYKEKKIYKQRKVRG